MKKNLNLLLTTVLVICSSVLLTAAQSRDGQGLRGQKGFVSPMMGFVEDKNEPLRIQINDFFAVKGNKKELQIKMVAGNLIDKPLSNFTVYCEEEFKQPTAKGIAKQIHRLSLNKTGFFTFEVKRDSKLTFWLGTVEYQDGTVWANKLK